VVGVDRAGAGGLGAADVVVDDLSRLQLRRERQEES